MSLFKVDTSRVTGRGAHIFDGTGIRMINGLGVSEVIDQDDGSSFEYVLNLENDREGIARIDSSYIPTAIAGYVNASFLDTFVTLLVYPNQNTSASPISQLIPSRNITLGYSFSGGSILYIKEGIELQRYLVKDTIDEILEITSESTVYWDDGTDYFRLDVRNSALYLDQVILPSTLGFDGEEDVDWGAIWGVNNNVGWPTFENVFVNGDYPDSLNIQFSETINPSLCSAVDLSFITDGDALSFTSSVVFGRGNTILFGLSRDIVAGETITVSHSYTDSVGSLRSQATGLPVVYYADYPVTNNVT